MAWWTLYKREMAAYFQSMVAYILLAGGALYHGITFAVNLEGLIKNPGGGYDMLELSFLSVFYFILTLIQVPLLTMRTFSEEFKMGTIEMLLTAPVNEWSIVMAKFLGAFSFYLIFWSPLVLDIAALQIFTPDPPPINPYEIMIIVLTTSLMGSFYCAIGIFSSVLTRNQIVAAITCFTLLFAYLGYGMASSMMISNGGATIGAPTQELLNYFSLFNHMDTAKNCFFDSRPVVFYLSATAFMLVCTQRILLSHRLQG